jgi:hypothetical protein
MKQILAAVVVLAAIGQPARAQDQLANEAAVRQLLEVTQARKLLDSTMGQMDAFMYETMKRALAGRPLTPEQQAILDDAKTKTIAILQGELQCEKLEPSYIDIYRKSFTDEEISGMLAFYRTPAGQAVINKLPVVMQHTMDMMQEVVQRIAPQIRQIQSEAFTRLK